MHSLWIVQVVGLLTFSIQGICHVRFEGLFAIAICFWFTFSSHGRIEGHFAIAICFWFTFSSHGRRCRGIKSYDLNRQKQTKSVELNLIGFHNFSKGLCNLSQEK